MPKYMVKGSFTQSGVQGIIKEGGTSRRETIGKMVEDLGGSLEGFYFGFGSTDVYFIAELPDAETATAISLAVGASGAVETETVVLITPEEMDAATKKSVDFRPPGA